MRKKALTVQDWLQTNDQMCVDIVDRKYLLEEEILGHKETIDEMLDRVSGGNKEARKLMEQMRFLPGGRIIANRGLSKYGIKVTYSNCYVDPAPEDSIESIYTTCKRLARTFSYGGGIGIDISKLAPEGAKVNNTARKSTGAVSFVNTFSEVAETIGMKGRRGALMISIDGHHPDLEKFITHKSDLGITQGANMSVRMTNDFFDAVENDKDWILEFTRKETGEVIKKVTKARDIMNLIAKTNWDYAEPGFLYWDNMTKYNLMSEDKSFSYAGTNPCGEEPLPAGGSCLLGAMNLSAYWDKDSDSFNTTLFSNDVKVAVKFLNEVLDEGQDLHPLPEQRECVSKWRQIGLGFMGLADLFIKAKIRYGSQDSLDLIHKIGYVMIASAIQESINLARALGSFIGCDPVAITKSSFWNININNNPYLSKSDIISINEDICKYGMRNSQLLTCAPTGTISTIFNISGGIEPVFALQFTRTTKSIYDEDRTYTVYPKAVEEFLKDNKYKSLNDIPNNIFPDFLVTSREILWKDRIDVQAAWQKHIDASISATINLPESTTVEDIVNLYMYGHKAGLKGTTVFRENCKRIAILYDTYNKKSEDKEESDGSDIVSMAKTVLDKTIESTGIPKELILGSGDDKDALSIIETLILRDKERYVDTEPTEDIKASEAITEVPDEKKEHVKPMVKDTTDEEFVNLIKNKFANSFTRISTRADFKEDLHGTTYYKRVACGHIYITVNRFLGRPVEVFMQSSKSGGCAANTEALGRLASTMLRAGIDPDIVVDSTLGVKCSACSAMKGKGENIDGLSCSDVMARVIRDEYQKYTRGEYDNEILEYVSKRMSYEEKWELLNQGSQNKTPVLEESKKVADKLISKAFIEEANEIKAARWNYKDHTVQENIDHYICPECGHSLRLAEGCMVCDNCGFSKC